MKPLCEHTIILTFFFFFVGHASACLVEIKIEEIVYAVS